MLKYASAQVMSKVLAPSGMNRQARRAFAHRHHFDYDVRPGYLYVRSRAISSRCNDNFDEFPAAELAKSYASFKGKPVFVNHNNEDHKRARGVVIDAVLHKDANRDGSPDHWVEVLMEVDALRFPRLAAEILSGNIARTSMGCDVAYSICSACKNKATSPAEYCVHIPGLKGQRIYRRTASGSHEGVLIRETCYGLKFFENSLLVEPPADPTAYFLAVDARGLDKAAAKDQRFAEVGLGEDEDGHYVKTHRARSDSYPTPEDIPQADVDRIAATGSLVTAAHAYSWDEIGHLHPHVYGEGDEDSEGIAGAANELAHGREADPEAEGSSVDDLKFHYQRVKPSQIDHMRQERGDPRVASAAEGYRHNPDQVPPLVLVHRHGVYQVADGHHRAQAAKEAKVSSVPAYVAYSPHEDEPFGDGSSAPFHGAAKSPAQPPGRRDKRPFSGEGWDQDSLFNQASRLTLTDLFAPGSEMSTLTAEAAARQPAEPSEHSWFKEVPMSHQHVIAHWDQATPEEKSQGARWYPDAHHVAKAIAKLDPSIKDDKEAAHKGAGVLSAYSPQQNWWANQHNAARSFVNGKAVGKGEGLMVMGSHATAAQRVMNGENHQDVLKGPKTQDFAHLIEHGGKDEEGNPSKRVVIDRHALSVAAGRRLNADDVKGFKSGSRPHYEHVAEQYRTAAAVLSHREGRTIAPHEVQAVTWLTRQRLNADQDATSPGGKGRITVQKNQREKWKDLTREHTPHLHEEVPPNSHVSKKLAVDKPYGDVEYADPGLRGDKARYPINTPEHIRAAEDYIHHPGNERKYSPGELHEVEDKIDHAAEEHGIGDHKGSLFLAFGETKAPQDVDTLREDSCPVCGDRDTYDGTTCSVCGYVAPPSLFQDPDLSVARNMDLRKNVEQFTGQPGMPVDPDQLGPDGQPMDPSGGPGGTDAMDQTGNPAGGLPGEVQAEVQPAGDGPGNMPGVGNGIPDSDGMVPQIPGQTTTPDQLGPDGQPTSLPGDQVPNQQNVVLGPDGMPVGPQPLPAAAISGDGKPFNPGPNMPGGPGEPEGPVSPDELGPDGMPQDGQQPDPQAGGGAPGTPGDGVPDLSCPSCGFMADSTPPTSVNMDTSLIPPNGMASPDGVQAGDICPNCGQGVLMSPAEVTGQDVPPQPGTVVPGA
jgi:hypothetical protein